MSIITCHSCDAYVDTDNENTIVINGKEYCENCGDDIENAEYEKVDAVKDMQAPNWPKI